MQPRQSICLLAVLLAFIAIANAASVQNEATEEFGLNFENLNQRPSASRSNDEEFTSETSEDITRVKRQYGYGGYGYGGNQWSSYCCNYGYRVSYGCRYNGFWNARNNPACGYGYY